MANTPNYNLYKPNRVDNLPVDTTLSDNFTIIDTEIKNRKDEIDTHNNELNTRIDDEVTELNARIGNIIATSGTSDTELVDSRQGYTVLRDRFDDEWINVKTYGAKGDNASDDADNIQTAIDKVKNTGGTVYLPKGIYRVSKPLNIYSNVKLKGDGWTNTYIKPLNSAVIPTNQGIVQTKDFLTNRNAWDFYPPYPTGLHMGVGLEDICIDGNRASQTTGNGLCIYGGKWTLNRVAVINTAEHGIWTECGKPNSSTSGDDLHDFLNMHEATAEQIFIANTNKHGWNYKGPNDTYINNVQIKMAGWAGFYQDKSNSLFESGGLKIGSLHAYYCDCLHDVDGYMIHLTSAQANSIYTDTSKAGGIKLTGGNAVIINQIFSLTTNCNNIGDFWAVKIDTANCIIGQLRESSIARTTGTTNGGILWTTTNGTRALIGSIRSSAPVGDTIATTAIKVEGIGTNISQISITGFSLAGSTGLILNASECTIQGNFISCAKGVDYKNTTNSRNRIQVSFQTCPIELATETTFATNDIIDIITNSNTLTRRTIGTADVSQLRYKILTTPYAASITPDAKNSVIAINTIAGAMTINSPTNATTGSEITFYLAQDGTGGRAITWNSNFKTNYSDAGNSAFKRYTITFIFDGTFWIQKGVGSGWY